LSRSGGPAGDLEALDRQRAFTALLGRPVVDREADPALWPLVRRHRPVLTDWFSTRLGYRLVVSDQAARLYRPPAGGVVIAPAPLRPPPRRAMVLALLAAAAAEDTEDVTTVQELSDRVRALSTRDDVPVADYDPDRYAERSVFVRAVELLAGLGALHRIGRGADSEQLLSGWARRQDALGGAYEVDRELLLRLVEPSCLVAALAPGAGNAEDTELTRRHLVMRRLLELPVCLFADLGDAERQYLARQRSRMLGWCREMTGWTAEVRAEGIALIPSEASPGGAGGGTDLAFPERRADHFGALMILDALVRSAGSPAADSSDGRPPEAPSLEPLFGDDDVMAAASRICFDHRRALTKELRDDPRMLADAALHLLGALDLIRREPAAGAKTGNPADAARVWRLMPAAARFRNPKIVITQPRLGDGDESGSGEPDGDAPDVGETGEEA
jgi:uncharacterized protein (TIGR02678 family)